MSSNNSCSIKFNEICRTCLKGGQLLTYLYDEENNINLVKKLITCTALQFDKNDQMPDKICPTCIEELLQAYNFINKCQISETTLKKYLLNERMVNEKMLNERLVNGRLVNERLVNEKIINERTTNEKLTNDKIMNERAINENTTNEKIPNEKIPNEKIPNEKTPNNKIPNENNVVPKIEEVPVVPEHSIKTETHDEADATVQEEHEEHFDLVSDISIKEELIAAGACVFTENSNKRKREHGLMDCSVDLGCKKMRGDFDDGSTGSPGLNSTFSAPDNDHVVPPARKTRSEMGKENFAKNKTSRKSLSNYRKRRKFGCPICSRKLANVVGLLTHFQTHTETSNPDETRCFNTRQSKQIKENASYRCEICWKFFTGTDQLFAHFQQHITAGKCEYCGKIFKPGNLRKHVVEKHAGSNPYTCQLCNQKMTDADALQSHIAQLHCPENGNGCQICSCTFETPDELKSHQNGHIHGVSNCHSCKLTFEDAHGLIAHKVGKKCGKFYRCGDCPEIFQLLRQKNLHRAKHN